MAVNFAPEVQAARDFSKQFGADRVVVIYTTDSGQIGYASYGKTRERCASAKRLADALYTEAVDHCEEHD
jgi:hypothetical protein